MINLCSPSSRFWPPLCQLSIVMTTQSQCSVLKIKLHARGRVGVLMLLQVLAGRSSQSSLNPFDLRAWRLVRQQNTLQWWILIIPRKMMTWIIDFILCLDDNESKGQPGSTFVLGEHGFFFFVQCYCWVDAAHGQWVRLSLSQSCIHCWLNPAERQKSKYSLRNEKSLPRELCDDN